MFGKLLGVGENVTDLESEEHLMYNITLSLHGRTLVSAMHTYIIHMVYGGSLLKYIMYTMEDAVEQLPFTTHLSVTYSCTPDIRNCLDLSPQYKSVAYLSFPVYSVAMNISYSLPLSTKLVFLFTV